MTVPVHGKREGERSVGRFSGWVHPIKRSHLFISGATEELGAIQFCGVTPPWPWERELPAPVWSVCLCLTYAHWLFLFSPMVLFYFFLYPFKTIFALFRSRARAHIKAPFTRSHFSLIKSFNLALRLRPHIAFMTQWFVLLHEIFYTTYAKRDKDKNIAM